MSKITTGEIGFYQDVSQLKSVSGRQDLDAAAEGFEAMFLQMVLKSMRSGADALADENGPLSNAEQGVFRDLYDGQLASVLAARGDVGIAAAIGKQLGGSVGSESLQSELKYSDPVVANQDQQPSNDRLTAFQQPLRSPIKPDGN